MAELDPKATEKKIPVLVVVPAREGYDGYWCIGRKFSVGSTELLVTEAELKMLREDEAKKLPIAVVEFSPIEQAQRLAAAAESEAAKAEAEAARALEEADKKAAAAKAAKEALAGAQDQLEKAGGKGKK